MELHPESRNPGHKPTIVDLRYEDFAIVAVVVGAIIGMRLGAD